MPNRDIVVMGASAGGVEAYKSLVKELPPDLPAVIFVVMHMPSSYSSALPYILSRSGRMPVEPAQEGTHFTPGHIYVCVPDRHLLLVDSRIHLSQGAHENRNRPAIDPLFRSAARWYGNRVIGIVLSGTLDDGTSGLAAIKEAGGITIAQDPDEALYPGMPESAIENVEMDYVLPVAGIAALLSRLVREPVQWPEKEGPVADQIENEQDQIELNQKEMETGDRPGHPSVFSCPECGGVLWETEDGKLVRYRCRVGHAFSPESLLDAQSAAMEDAIWAALRALEEKVDLSNRLAERSRRQGQEYSAARFQEQADEGHKRAELLRKMLSDKQG